jgi:hypothetical protein
VVFNSRYRSVTDAVPSCVLKMRAAVASGAGAWQQLPVARGGGLAGVAVGPSASTAVAATGGGPALHWPLPAEHSPRHQQQAAMSAAPASASVEGIVSGIVGVGDAAAASAGAAAAASLVESGDKGWTGGAATSTAATTPEMTACTGSGSGALAGEGVRMVEGLVSGVVGAVHGGEDQMGAREATAGGLAASGVQHAVRQDPQPPQLHQCHSLQQELHHQQLLQLQQKQQMQQQQQHQQQQQQQQHQQRRQLQEQQQQHRRQQQELQQQELEQQQRQHIMQAEYEAMLSKHEQEKERMLEKLNRGGVASGGSVNVCQR